MSKVTKTLFGGGSGSSESGTTFAVRSTPYSSFNGEMLRLDPTVRSLQEESLTGFRGLHDPLRSAVSDFVTNMRSTRESLLGNAGLYRQARVSPVAQAAAQRSGEVRRNIGLRNIGGSSFAEQAISNVDFESARQIGEASAIADAETLNAVTGIDKDILNAMIGKIEVEANLYGYSADIAKQRLQQELESFGLGKGQASSSTQSTQQGIFAPLQFKPI